MWLFYFGAPKVLHDCYRLFRRDADRVLTCDRPAGDLADQSCSCCSSFHDWRRCVDLRHVYSSSLCAHHLVPTQHALHHARPDKAVLMVSWQIWVCFAIVYLVAGGSWLAGGLVAYAWYLFVHHCAHHASRGIPLALLKHHQTHHRFATRNYGVSTTIWDHVFGTLLHPARQATAHAQRRELAAPDLTRG